MTADFSTPEGALQSLEAAYAARDIEAAVAARHFGYEAVVILRDIRGIPDPTPDLVQQTARNLETAFRRQVEADGFPDTVRTRRTLISSDVMREDLVALVQECTFPDGSVAKETTFAVKTNGRWGIVELDEP